MAHATGVLPDCAEFQGNAVARLKGLEERNCNLEKRLADFSASLILNLIGIVATLVVVIFNVRIR